MRKCVLILAMALPLGFGSFGQDSARSRLDSGISSFQVGGYAQALEAFGAVLADPTATEERPEALYWSALATMALGDSQATERSIQTFLSSFPGNPHVPDLLYQKGRIQFGKADYQGALVSFAAFMSAAPSHDLYSSALFWSGEALYALGRLEEARRAFAALIDRYPQSVKLEAASHRRDLIDLEFREEELLKLLTWSHEESLRSIDDFRRKERAYEQAITVYQKELADLKRGAVTDAERDAADLRSKVADLSAKLVVSDANLASARSELNAMRSVASKSQEEAVAIALAKAKAEADAAAKAAAPGSVVPSTAVLSAEVLATKARALDLLAFYLTKLSAGGTQ
ncbi:MAG: tetratricopeptide repeat protein [Spirochaetota bacterium]